jgi:hypothetical protein
MTWRMTFLGLGIYMLLLGLQLLAVDRVTWKHHWLEEPPRIATRFGFPWTPAVPEHPQSVPPHWAPWLLLGSGGIVVIYSFTLPRRLAGAKK